MILGIRKLMQVFKQKVIKIGMEFLRMKNRDGEALLFNLQGVDWEMTASTACSDPNAMANNFCDLLHSVLDVDPSLKTQKGIKQHTPSLWISPSIKNLIHKIGQAKKRAEKDRLIWPE